MDYSSLSLLCSDNKNCKLFNYGMGVVHKIQHEVLNNIRNNNSVNKKVHNKKGASSCGHTLMCTISITLGWITPSKIFRRR